MWSLNAFETLAVALIVYLFGEALNRRFAFLQRYCIPAPVSGGLVLSVLLSALMAANILQLKMDFSMRSYFMLLFFTTIGFGASFRLLKLGGKLLVTYWLICGGLALVQNLIGVSLAYQFDLPPLLGVLLGAVSMEGGHGAAGAFGETIQNLGVEHALAVGLAAATLGLVAGGLVGTPLARHLIERHGLKPKEHQTPSASVNPETSASTDSSFIRTLLLIVLCAIVGKAVAAWFSSAFEHFSMPAYVPAMFMAVLLRNFLDREYPELLDFKAMRMIGDVSLAIFLSMALMSINLLQIKDLALPLLAIVGVQVLFVVLFAYLFLFRIMGRDYDAAVMVAGFCGHALGATPNAVANMGAISKRFGMSQQAFIIVPVVGAFLIDVFGLPIILTTINLLK